MEIRAEKYSVVYDPDNAVVHCNGALLLNGAKEYEPILQLLNAAANGQKDNLTINLCDLKFLNSSGINMVTRFIINVFDVEALDIALTIKGQKKVAWQEKLLKNLQRLAPNLNTMLD
ncbi:hypothetical protein QUF74_16445 [Candidatus Halobeggiatoa sp. HSG11]|nr:hypothetical protein [Candidatus Halobeggiatoa sp. HSG11]